jgi:hypothetical protein
MRNLREIAADVARRGELSKHDESLLVVGLTAWWRDGCEPERLAPCLHLQIGARAATAERNKWLRVAAEELPEKNVAAEMYRRIRSFSRSEWPDWRGRKDPPDDAEPFLKALFYAADAGAPMNIGRRQLGDILRG